MAEQRDPRYAERMFPAPADPGIARPDRAASSVRSGTDTAQSGDYKNELWYQGSGRIGERPVESIVSYPPTGGMTTQGDPFKPVKIGVLIDMDLGQLAADLMDPIILAVEDAEVKAGLEQIKWMPATNGGPGCYITFAEYDHRGYKGDFLTIRELRGGELHFRGYFRPQHPSNTSSPLLKQE